MTCRWLSANVLTALFLACAFYGNTAQGDEIKPAYSGQIVDAHVHYSKPAWSVYPPQAILEKFDAAGVSEAMVSSTPDDGTLSLHSHSPERIVRFLRPYRTRADMGNWFADKDVVAYVEERLNQNVYQGFGEFHMYDPMGASTPEMKTLLKLAADRGLILHSHSGPDVVEALAKATPGLTILWAHAGLSSSPAMIGQIFARYPQVYADLSFRGDEVLGQGRINADWMNLFSRFPDRMMIGSDTYITEQWDGYQQLIDQHRRWLGHLPPKMADAIARGNAQKMLGR
ncbi:MAG: amidohydrolase family protein [Rhodospirillales bacterium]|nr:amidohydrolase family protein [Rhodospirillales bacterium]